MEARCHSSSTLSRPSGLFAWTAGRSLRPADNAGDRTVSAALYAQARRAGRRQRPDLSKAAIPCSPCGRATIASNPTIANGTQAKFTAPRDGCKPPFANAARTGSDPAASANIDYAAEPKGSGLLGNAYAAAVPERRQSGPYLSDVTTDGGLVWRSARKTR